MTEQARQDYRAGMVAVAGRPNVGKSSLVNQMVGQKISIVTHKAQTTRHRIAAVASFPQGQLVLLDTPGIHRQASRALNKQMNRTAQNTLNDADALLMVVEAGHWTGEDQDVLKRVLAARAPGFIALNKIDRIKDKSVLLPFIQEHFSAHESMGVFPISARTGNGVDALVTALLAAMPVSPPLYPDDQLSDRPVEFLAAELIREQAMQRLHEELPYGLTVTIDAWRDHSKVTEIHAVIWIQRDSHKGMVIGKGGEALKQIGSGARHEIQALIDRPVNLRLWVRVRQGWCDDEKALSRFGYRDK